MDEIKIKCRGADQLPVQNLIGLQGNLKTMRPANLEKLINSILTEGFIAPIFIWKDGEENRILDGHGRLKALEALAERGYTIPPLPVDYVDAESFDDARRKLLKITSQFGEFDLDELGTWIEELGSDIADQLRLAGEEIELSLSPVTPEEESDPYTAKIKAPIYEPKMDCPPVSDLLSREKSETLIAEIKAAKIEDKALESFLLAAATRHIVFDYQNIAEYYAHADAHVQALMEKSALVIIDFEKAVENGFIRLTQELAVNYLEGEQLLEDEE